MHSEYTASHAEHQALLAIGAVSIPWAIEALKILSKNLDGLNYTAWCVLSGKDPKHDAGMFVYNLRKMEEGRLIEKNSIGRYKVTFLGKSVLDFQRYLKSYLESMEGKKIPVIWRETSLTQNAEEPKKLGNVIKLTNVQNIMLKVLGTHEDFGLKSRSVKTDVEEIIGDRLEEAEIRHGLLMLRMDGYICRDGNRNVLTEKGKDYVKKFYPKNNST